MGDGANDIAIAFGGVSPFRETLKCWILWLRMMHPLESVMYFLAYLNIFQQPNSVPTEHGGMMDRTLKFTMESWTVSRDRGFQPELDSACAPGSLQTWEHGKGFEPHSVEHSMNQNAVLARQLPYDWVKVCSY